MINKFIYFSALILAVLIVIIAVADRNQQQVFAWNQQSGSYDFVRIDLKGIEPTDNCSSQVYKADFSANQLSVFKNGDKIWQTDDSWFVTGYCFADSNNDGKEELNLSVWKKGSFGKSKPFWVKENDMSEKYHFFVYELEGDIVSPLWQSSALSGPNCEFTFADVNNDSQLELVAVEGEYHEAHECSGRYVAVWKWNEWGFFNLWRSKKSRIWGLKIIEKNSINYISATFYQFNNK